MRDEYIRLIKEYIKLKPEYKHILKEIKANVMSVGATEEEFDEAIKQITGISAPSQLLQHNPEQAPITEEKYYSKLSLLINKSKNHISKNKKRAGIATGIAAAAIISLYVLKLNQEAPKNQIVPNLNKKAQTAGENKGPVPAVYANTQPINAKKVFSHEGPKALLTVTGKPKKEILGFFPYWMLDEQEKINFNTLTSISLFGLEVDANGNIVTHNNDGPDGGWVMWQDPKFETLLKRAKAQDIKIYLTFKSFNNNSMEKLVLSDTAQRNFITNALYLVNSKNLDGINIDFEYLGSPSSEVKKGFTRLVANLYEELKGQMSDGELSVDTYLASGTDDGLFDIEALNSKIDNFVIMGYDMHTPLGTPGPVSAMGGDTNVIGYVQGYLEKIPANKIILAVPYYGYDWPQVNNETPTSQTVKILPYAEIAEINKKLIWDNVSQTPSYKYSAEDGFHIVHFDNVRSLGIKYDFIIKKDLKGVGIWALGYDGLNSDLQRLLVDKFIN